MAVDKKSRFDVFESDINFNLLYYKFPYFENDKFLFYQKKRKDKNQSPIDKKWLLGEQPHPKDEYKDFFEDGFIQKIQKQHYQAIGSLGYHLSEYYENEPDWRLIVGLGTQSVYEVGMTLHHTFGIPYIPASAIKGALRSYWMEEYHESDEGKAIKDKEFCDIFGCPNEVQIKEEEDTKNKTYESFYNKGVDEGFRKGQIIFFDAFPIEVPTISPDIMNNHYPDYYEGAKKPPADWQSPRPITFLTVKNTKFKFVLGCKRKEEALINKVLSILKEALEFKGIGAKTAIGYGYMSDERSSIIENETINCEEKPKAKAEFIQKGKLNPKKRYRMEGIITQKGRPNLAAIYVGDGVIQKDIKIDLFKNLLEVGTVIKVEVGINKKGVVTQASYKGPK